MSAAYTVDDVEIAARSLNDLMSIICEVQFELPAGGTDERINSLLWIARDLSEGLYEHCCVEAQSTQCDEAGSHGDAELEALIVAHDRALAAYEADDNCNLENDVTGHAVDAARDAILDHRPGTIVAAVRKAAYMASRKTFTEWDNFDQRRLIEALTPVSGVA